MLRLRGHEVVAPDMPLDDPATTYEQRIEPVLTALADVAEPIVVVGHSLGAIYAPLVATVRPTALVAYLCPAPLGLLLREDAPLNGTKPSFPFPRGRADGLSVWDDGAAAIAAMYSRLTPEAARSAAAHLRPDAPPLGSYPLTHHPEVPVALIYASDDEFFEPEWERWTAREVLGVEPIEIDSGHFPMLEAPERLADLL